MKTTIQNVFNVMNNLPSLSHEDLVSVIKNVAVNAQRSDSLSPVCIAIVTDMLDEVVGQINLDCTESK